MESKSIPKRLAIESEINTLQIVLEPSWLDLVPSRPGLGPSWGDFGPAGEAENVDCFCYIF